MRAANAFRFLCACRAAIATCCALALVFGALNDQAYAAEPDENIACVQHRLAELGFDPGPVDGLLGRGTKAAYAEYQESFLGPAGVSELKNDGALLDCVDIALNRTTAHRIPVDTGIELEAFLHRPLGNGRAFPAVVILHGWGGSAREVNYTARLLTASGFAALTVSMRGWGASDGTDDCGLKQSDDLVEVSKWLAARSEIDADRIGYLGYSQGGQVALLAAAKTDMPKFVVAFFPPTDMETWAKQTTNEGIPDYIKTFCGPDLDANSPVSVASDISAPVLLIHGTRDSRVPVTQSLSMAKAIEEAGGDVQTRLVPGQPHLFSDETWGNVIPDALAFIRKYLAIDPTLSDTKGAVQISESHLKRILVYADIPALSLPTNGPPRITLISPTCRECVQYLLERTTNAKGSVGANYETLLFFAQNDADLEIINHLMCDRLSASGVIFDFFHSLSLNSHFMLQNSEVDFYKRLLNTSRAIAISHGIKSEHLLECENNLELSQQLAAVTSMIAWPSPAERYSDQRAGDFVSVQKPWHSGGAGVGPSRNTRFLTQLRALNNTLRSLLRQVQIIEAQRDQIVTAVRSSTPQPRVSNGSSVREIVSGPTIPVRQVIESAVQDEPTGQNTLSSVLNSVNLEPGLTCQLSDAQCVYAPSESYGNVDTILAGLRMGRDNKYHNGVDSTFMSIVNALGLNSNFQVTDASYPAGLGSGGDGGAGFIYPPPYDEDLQGECVALTRALTGVGVTDTWEPDIDASLGTLTPGSPIATFTNGEYDNRHAAVFVSYIYSSAGQPIGMYLLDQNNSPDTTKPAGIRYYLYDDHDITYHSIRR